MKYALILTLLLFSCQDEVIEPTPTPPPNPSCNCYEYHEALVLVNFNFQWVHDFNSATFEDFCSKDNGSWSYLDNDTKRYKYICQ
jgi:hypothetical protein